MQAGHEQQRSTRLFLSIASKRLSLSNENISLRALRGVDLGAVIKIERAVQVNPWSRLSFEQSLTQGHICRVVEYGHEIIAFHIVCPVVDELHILNLAVASDQQGKGLGHVLLDDIVQQGNKHKVDKIFLEVRQSNLVAQSLYQKWQFQQIAMRKDYYSASAATASPGTREDALVLVRKLDKFS